MNLKATLLSLVVLVLSYGPAAAAVVWSGEFDGVAIDPYSRTYDVGGHGFGNGQFEHNATWSNLGGSIAGNAATNTGCDPLGPPHNFYPGSPFDSRRLSP